MPDLHLNSEELALELTKLTIEKRPTNFTEWNSICANPEKWGGYVRDVT
jgi:hypothetical protein